MLLVIRTHLSSCVKISNCSFVMCILIFGAYIPRRVPCLGYLCGVSGHGLLNIIHLCHAYYAVPFPRMEFYHFICIEQCVNAYASPRCCCCC